MKKLAIKNRGILILWLGLLLIMSLIAFNMAAEDDETTLTFAVTACLLLGLIFYIPLKLFDWLLIAIGRLKHSQVTKSAASYTKHVKSDFSKEVSKYILKYNLKDILFYTLLVPIFCALLFYDIYFEFVVGEQVYWSNSIFLDIFILPILWGVYIVKYSYGIKIFPFTSWNPFSIFAISKNVPFKEQRFYIQTSKEPLPKGGFIRFYIGWDILLSAAAVLFNELQ